MIKPLTKEQIKLCTELLSQLPPGLLPLEIFNQVARLVCLPTVHLIPIKIKDKKLEIGLIKRKKTDLWWPDMWHLPGTIFRSTDTMQSCLKRLLKEEIMIKKSDPPIFRTFIEHQSKRGAELIFMHSLENCTLGVKSPVKWFSIQALPEKLVETEIKAITEVEKYFRATR